MYVKPKPGRGAMPKAVELFKLAGQRRGSLTGCMVAATAVGAGAHLATSNPADFRRFEPAGLTIVTA